MRIYIQVIGQIGVSVEADVQTCKSKILNLDHAAVPAMPDRMDNKGECPSITKKRQCFVASRVLAWNSLGWVDRMSATQIHDIT